MIVFGFVVVFALLGAPVFAVMAGATELAWLTHDDSAMRFVRFLAPDVLDERFTGNPVLITIPLFTFVGYVMAKSKAPERIVRASNAFLGWMPGGLAVVCIVSSAFFTTLSGGSAVTIVAIGGLLYPALLQKGYPKDYALGLVMTGGSLGLLLPPSIPIVVYSIVAGIDFTKAFKALLIPGLLVMVLLALHAAIVARRAKIPLSAPDLREMKAALWDIKWELAIPVVILGGLGTGLASIDEVAALAALYVGVVEIGVHRDIRISELPRVTATAMALAGAVMLIMAMATSLTNYVVSEQIPVRLFEYATSFGLTEQWQFLLLLNVFLYVVGMLMDGISSIVVVVPLIIPFAAGFILSPFHLAAMFLLNLEIAYLSPPLGQNLFVSSFRFNTPMVRLYRIAIPFLVVLITGLVLVMAVPRLSTFAVQGDIDRAYERAAARGELPRDAYQLDCVQEDPNDPQICDAAERARRDVDLDEELLDDLLD